MRATLAWRGMGWLELGARSIPVLLPVHVRAVFSPHSPRRWHHPCHQPVGPAMPRLIAAVIIGLVTYIVTNLAAIQLVVLIGGSPWVLMLFVYGQLAAAIAVAVLFSHGWKLPRPPSAPAET